MSNLAIPSEALDWLQDWEKHYRNGRLGVSWGHAFARKLAQTDTPPHCRFAAAMIETRLFELGAELNGCRTAASPPCAPTPTHYAKATCNDHPADWREREAERAALQRRYSL